MLISGGTAEMPNNNRWQCWVRKHDVIIITTRESESMLGQGKAGGKSGMHVQKLYMGNICLHIVYLPVITSGKR